MPLSSSGGPGPEAASAPRPPALPWAPCSLWGDVHSPMWGVLSGFPCSYFLFLKGGKGSIPVAHTGSPWSWQNVNGVWGPWAGALISCQPHVFGGAGPSPGLCGSVTCHLLGGWGTCLYGQGLPLPGCGMHTHPCADWFSGRDCNVLWSEKKLLPSPRPSPREAAHIAPTPRPRGAPQASHGLHHC